MNILLTSVGRRAYLVKYFKEVVGKLGQVHVCNSDDLTIAFKYADKSVISPLIYDENYIPFLIDYCKNNDIKIVVPLFDMDVLMLSKHKAELEEIGVKVIVSDEKFVAVCNDKWKTYEFLKENGFNVPKTYLSLEETLEAIGKGEISYPVVVKPRFGCGSLAVSMAESEEGLKYYYQRNKRALERTYLKYESAMVQDKIIFQEKIKGQEFGVDIINDLDKNFVNAIVKRKIAMRAGETDISETIENEAIFNVAKKLGTLSGHIANLDCDIFVSDDGKIYVLEMNARFGGGYPFSHMSGVDLPKAIVLWSEGQEPEKVLFQYKTGEVFYKELVIQGR